MTSYPRLRYNVDTRSLDGFDDWDLEGQDDISLSQYVHEKLTDVLKNPQSLESIKPFLKDVDAFCILNGNSSGQFPPLDWKLLRKSYSVLFWIRPILFDCQAEDEEERGRRLLYRFSTTPEDHTGVGVCVQCSNWVKKANNVEATLTCYGLPPRTQILQVPISLPLKEWSLVGVSHSFPYLKRPQWTLTVNGKIQGRGELSYPVVDGQGIVEHATILHNLAQGGCAVAVENTGDDTKKTASELANAQKVTFQKLQFHLASIAIYKEVVTSEIQALLYSCGPSLSIQHHGRIVCPLPPIENWTKGSSLDTGPNVGIPIGTHFQYALQVQHLCQKILFHFAASQAKIVKKRIILLQPYAPGDFDATPKVGLIQPSFSTREEDFPQLHFYGSTSVSHALSDFLLQTNAQVDTHLFHSTKLLSVALLEQGLLPTLCMPFFLAQTAPAQGLDLQVSLKQQSYHYLWKLYRTDWASALIDTVADLIEFGGGRAHEMVLQGGVIHILASSLRISLVRAELLKLEKYERVDDWLHAPKNEPPHSLPTHENVCPKRVPHKVAVACAKLVRVCCGNPIEAEYSPCTRIQRSSDLALSCVFGLGLNLDLWGKSQPEFLLVLREIASRYGNVQGGQILRRQIPVQSLLDVLRGRYETALPDIAACVTDIAQHMLLASLSHRSDIVMAEQDIAACMGALSDSPLGSVTAHVVLTSLTNILDWCNSSGIASDDDNQLVQIASRLGRNLVVSQYHDVVAPMLLSRTVFCGERSMSAEVSSKKKWDHHWRMALTLFAWVTSISGPEGSVAAHSTGSLLLASALAGSLRNSLVGNEKEFIANLFLPPPTMALMINNSNSNNTWTYTDLLEDRLQVMMPLLPGLVISLVTENVSSKIIQILEEMLGAVCGSFHRVLGHWMQVHAQSTTGMFGRKIKGQPESSPVVKAAKDYIPQFVLVVAWLEHNIRKLDRPQDDDVIIVFKRRNSGDGNLDSKHGHGKEHDAWTDTGNMNSGIYDPVLDVNFQLQHKGEKRLHSCLKSVLSIVTDLICHSLRIGGGNTSTAIWMMIVATLDECMAYSGGKDSENARNLSTDIFCRLAAIVLTKVQEKHHEWEMWSDELCSSIARLMDLVEERDMFQGALSSDQILLECAILDVMKYGREMTGWCQLLFSPGSKRETSRMVGDEGGSSHNRDEEQNDKNAAGGTDANRINLVQADIPGTSSKALLPILLPSLRVTFLVLKFTKSDTKIAVPADKNAPVIEATLIEFLFEEIKQSAIAAIVGLSFPNARDTALNGLVSIRKAIDHHREQNDTISLERCTSLFVEVVKELGVRYDGESRLREKALFDAYDNGDMEEAEASQAIERMILGGDLIPSKNAAQKERIEEVTFDEASPKKNDSSVGASDFVMFHEAYHDNQEQTGGIENLLRDSGGNTKMAWEKYKGLGSALKECSRLITSDETSQTLEEQFGALLSMLNSYLDIWDTNSARIPETNEVSDESDRLSQSGLDIQRSETAADAMSTYIEMASMEKSRLLEFIVTHLPSHRSSIEAYADRYCWSNYFELIDQEGDCGMDQLWERGIADGNRDIRSRLISMPCNPQFKRRLPRFMDNGDEDESENSQSKNETELITSDTKVDDKEDEEVYKEITKRASESRKSIVDVHDSFNLHKSLVDMGKLEIVDITKKEISEEHLELVEEFQESKELDDFEDDQDVYGDGSLGFPSREDENKKKSSEDSADGDAEVTGDDQISAEATRIQVKSHQPTFHHHICTSLYAHPPDNSSSILTLMHSSAPAIIEKHFDNCLHVKAEGSRKCTMLLTSTHLILEYDATAEGLFEGELMAVKEEAERQRLIEDAGGAAKESSYSDADRMIEEMLERRQKEMAGRRPKSIRWNLSELSHVYLRRYRLRDSSLEMFFIPSGGTSFGGFGLYSPATSLFLDFGSGHDGGLRRDEAAHAIMRRSPPQTIKQWPDKSGQFLHEQLSRLTMGWVEGRITNFDYLLHLNMLAGRSYNDLCQYPVMPWVLSDYTNEEIPDLTDPSSFRDLSKPMGALNPDRLEDFLERFNTFADPTIPPFMYGSHYSTSAGVVLHFLVRMHPFAGLHRQLQGGHFDVADRLFSSIPRTWEMCTGHSAAEVKELTPEWYCNPAYLKNVNKFKLGTSQDGELLGDVTLPPWAKGSPETFVEVMRNALESDICSEKLPDWIDLIFGRKQQGPEAIKANNVFFYLTYYGSVDVASIEDEGLRQATELQIAHFGQCPMQLFVRPHVRRVPRILNFRKLTFYQMLSAYAQGVRNSSSGKERTLDRNRDGSQRVFGQPFYLPFEQSPMTHWIHLSAPAPGPHANLIAVRLAGVDRCLAVDGNGIFHSFRWAWKPEPVVTDDEGAEDDQQIDRGNFIAQRELTRFKTVPRLIHVPSKREDFVPAVAISKTLFASRSVLLVLSDGDGRGALSMQLVDPAKGNVKGEAVVPAIHSARITAISMDPIGTAAGHGGVGGELAIVGSADGGASLWRFMSSHFLPLRPRIRMRGHGGCKVHAVALSSAIHICASVSAGRCCIFSIGNGALIRAFPPPTDTLDLPTEAVTKTVFCDTPALCLSVQGFVVTVCKTTIFSEEGFPARDVITLHLFSLEGVSLGSKAMESWRGVPHKMMCTPDGTAVTVCSGRGVTIHRLSAITPLEFIDEWHITESEDLNENIPAAWDVDYGPSLMRPIVAAAACSSGALRLHALPGITPWSERHNKASMSFGEAFSRTGGRIKDVVGRGFGFGKTVVGAGKDISKEVASDVKEKGVGGFLAGTLFRKNPR